MTLYRYKAIGSDGLIHKGVIEVNSRKELKAYFRAHKLSPISSSRELSPLLRGKINTKSLMDMCLHLEQFENAGIPLIESLEELIKTQSCLPLRSVLGQVINDVNSGKLFSEALTKHPSFFNPVFVGLIAAGEKTGKLGSTYHHLSQHLKWTYDIRSQTVKAFRYPLIMSFALMAMILVLLTVLVPEMEKFMDMTSTPLPWSTLLLLALSHFFVDHIFILSFCISVFCGVCFFLVRFHPQSLFWKANLVERLPVIGPLKKVFHLAHFSHIFSLTFGNGIDILRALETTRHSLKYGSLCEAIKKVETAVKDGLSLSSALQQTLVFPPFMIQMVRVGEQTSSLETTLSYVQESFDAVLKRLVDHFVGLIEPFMMICVGLVLSWTVSSIFLPLYETLSTLDY